MQIDVHGVRLNVIDEGSGHPVLFLHGLGGCWRDWEPQLDAFSDRYRCVVIEHRGHGRSERTRGSYSIDLFAGDAIGVCEALDIDHAYVVGLSMGGMIAQAVTLARPDLVDALVLADTSGAADPALRDTIEQAAQMIGQVGLEAIITAYETVTWSAAVRESRPELVRDFRRESGGNDPDCYARSLRAISVLDHLPRLETVKAPALVIWGDEDGLTPRPHTDSLVEALPDAELAVLAGAGHITNIEQPDRFNDLVSTFFERHPCKR